MTNMVAALKRAMTLPASATGSAASSSTAAKRIRWEQIEEVCGDGTYLVKGARIPVLGLRTYSQYDVVPVASNRKGKRLFILGHNWRKAQFGPSFRETAAGIVEELLVADLDGTGADVWYRTHDQITKLEVTKCLRGEKPTAVKWGLDGVTFATQCTNGYYASFRLSRPDPNVLDEMNPGEVELKWMERPLASHTSLTSITAISRSTLHSGYSKCKTTVTWYQYHREFDYGRGTGGDFWALTSCTPSMDGETPQQGSASVSVTLSIPLDDLLAGRIVDGYGRHTVSGSVADWYLDTDGSIKFLIAAHFGVGEYCWLRTPNYGTGTYPYTYVWQGKLETRQETMGVSGSVAALGGRKNPVLGGEQIPESHLFLFNGASGAVEWSTAESGPQLGHEQVNCNWSRFEHIFESSSKDGEAAGPVPPPTDSWYFGANDGNVNRGTVRGTFNPPDIGSRILGNGTGQMMKTGLPFMGGTYKSKSESSYQVSMYLRGGYDVHFFWDGTQKSYSESLLWFHRIAMVKYFQTRVGLAGQYVDVPRLFVVVERYPFQAGTGWLNDLPQLWVGILDAQGALVRTLRDWQYGLNKQGTDLITANGHRIIWSLGTGGVVPTTGRRMTNLDTGDEMAFTAEQWTAFANTRTSLFTPDFAWDRSSPEAFFKPEVLPVLESDDGLSVFASLTPSDGQGDVRIINDESTLVSVDRYQAT